MFKCIINQNSTFCMSADGFHNAWLSFFVVHSKQRFCLFLWNHILIVEILLQEAFSGFPWARFDSKSCFESRLRSWKLFLKPAMNIYWENRPTREKEAGTEKTLELVSIFKEASRNYILIFLYKRQVKNVKPCAHVEKILIFYTPSKNIHLVRYVSTIVHSNW